MLDPLTTEYRHVRKGVYVLVPEGSGYYEVFLWTLSEGLCHSIAKP
jgi:hypothetical protein